MLCSGNLHCEARARRPTTVPSSAPARNVAAAPIVYPSTGLLGKKGILVGYYIQGQAGRPVGERTPAERQALALEQGGRIHPQYAAEFETAFSVSWHRVIWNRGSWSSASAETRKQLLQPNARVFPAGGHMNMNAWMQGAFESGRQVASAIHAQAHKP